MKKRVLDSGVFIENVYNKGVTSPKVAKETSVPVTVEIIEPKEKFLNKAKLAAKKTGDLDVLSPADLDIIALALQIDGIVVSNDFAVLNVAESLKIPWEGANKKIKKLIKWVWYCPACKRTYKVKKNCDFCGHITKRRPKNRSKER